LGGIQLGDLTNIVKKQNFIFYIKIVDYWYVYKKETIVLHLEFLGDHSPIKKTTPSGGIPKK